MPQPKLTRDSSAISTKDRDSAGFNSKAMVHGSGQAHGAQAHGLVAGRCQIADVARLYLRIPLDDNQV